MLATNPRPSPPGSTLADYTRPSLIVPRLRGNDADSVIRELAETLERDGEVPNAPEFAEAARMRERMASTEFTLGIAFPHARLAGVKQVCFALGRSEKPLRWGPENCASVRLVFLLAIPDDDTLHSLRLIAGLARWSKLEPSHARLLEAPGAIPMLDILGSVGLRSPTATDAV